MSIYIHHHLGLGDHFVCFGLVQQLVEQRNEPVNLAVKWPNLTTVSALYTGSRVDLVPVADDQEAQLRAVGHEYIRVGFEQCQFDRWEESFYEQFGMPYEFRFSRFRISRDREVEESFFRSLAPPEKYAFCATASSAGLADLNLKTSLPKIFLRRRTENLLDWLKVIELATEVHTIDTAAFQLAKNLDLGSRKFFYDVRASPFTFPQGQKWTVIGRHDSFPVTPPTSGYSVSLCVICCDLDYHLLGALLSEFSKQTEAPDEIIISSSGMREEQLHSGGTCLISGRQVPIASVNSERRINQAAARNAGARLSRSEVVLFFDVDDLPHPQKLEITRSVFREPGVGAFVHSYRRGGGASFVDHRDFSVLEVRSKDPDPASTNVAAQDGAPIHHAHIAVRRRVLDSIGFDESADYYRREDGKFCQDLIDSGVRLVSSRLPLVYYR